MESKRRFFQWILFGTLSVIMTSNYADTSPIIQRAQEFNAGDNRQTNPPPGDNVARFPPNEWRQYQANPDHNAAFTVSDKAPDWLRRGTSWQFAAHNALPLDGPSYQD